ncbi:hypothetical protein ATI61_117122 [Archangium gephyra]|uniref:Uncharacterized protein n=1 Tax=Archangium gephyra TaxID=48 RepID=A0AAC8TE93_9BACT|nr:hypothetical protein [Archangium gephyra]AKJ02732.1 Hypothetical protein AA314_04358 [Archangium gephyra]REG23277.1 hypothetical protein ATI61_117122 [Archangium gephyra]
MTSPINRRPTPFSPPLPARQEPKPTPSAAPPARKQTGYSPRNEFRSGTASTPVSLDPAASTLRNERLGDGSANCLERATALARPGDQVVLLRDSRDGVGHALVKHPDGSITDPNFPQHRYENLGQWQAMNPAYHSPVAIPDGQLERVLRTPPGPQRNALINQLGLSGVADRRVADGTRTTNLGVTFELQPEEFKSGRLAGSVTTGPYSGLSVELSWNPDRPSADGRFPVTVEVRGEVGGMREGELKVGPFGAEGSFAAGGAGTRTYTLNLTGDELAQLQSGQFSSLPTVTDPLAMPPGSTVMMSAELFGTLSVGASLGPVSLSEEAMRSHGYSFGVERLDGDRVRISAGPTEVMERSLALGIGFEVRGVEFSAELGRSSEQSSAAFASVELDLSTPEGQAAYEQFLNTRTLPADGPGVSNRAVSEMYTYEGALAAGVEAGAVSLGGSLWNESSSMVRTTQNGVTTETVTSEAAQTGNQMSVSYHDENGQRVFDAMTFDVAMTDGRRASVSITGEEGLESMRRIAWETASSNLMRFYGFDPANPQSVQEFQGVFEGTPEAALALQPGDPGFSYGAWTQAYNDLTLNRVLPELPAVAEAFIGSEGWYEVKVGLPPRGDAYTDMMAALDHALGTTDNESAFLRTTVAHGSSRDMETNVWMDFGLANAPGVSVSFQEM